MPPLIGADRGRLRLWVRDADFLKDLLLRFRDILKRFFI